MHLFKTQQLRQLFLSRTGRDMEQGLIPLEYIAITTSKPGKDHVYGTPGPVYARLSDEAGMPESDCYLVYPEIDESIRPDQ